MSIMTDQAAFIKQYPAVAGWVGLTASQDTVTVLAGKGGQHNEDRFKISPELLRHLLEGIFYSRKLVATYYIVITAVLLVLTLRHWIPRLWRWRFAATVDRHREALLDNAPPSYGSIENGFKATTTTKIGSSITGVPNFVYRKVRSWLLYQPKPIPVVHKVLPPNETSLAVLILLGINIFYLLYKVEFDVKLSFIPAARAGDLFAANLPLLYILSAKNQPIKFLTGHSYESLNIYHRRLGEWMILLSVVHSVGMLLVYLLLRKRDFTLWDFFTNTVVLLGIGALVSYHTIFTTSLGSFRQAFYELFLVLHIVFQLAALGFLFFHHSSTRVYVGLALGVYIVDRIVFRCLFKSNKFEASALVHPDNETVSLTVHLKVATENRRLKSIVRGIRGAWQPAEHVFVSIPALGGGHALQAHPFTIASAAPKKESPTAELKLLIRAQDGFSRQLLAFAEQRSVFDVRLDGPYGTSSALDLLREGEVSILVAAGSGIAVIWPLLKALLHQDKHLSDPESEAQAPQRTIVLIWVIREADHIHWLGQEALDDAKAKGVKLILPAPTEYGGRPNVDLLIEGSVKRAGAARKVRAICSGPDGFNRSARNAVASMVGRGLDADIEVHKYGW